MTSEIISANIATSIGSIIVIAVFVLIIYRDIKKNKKEKAAYRLRKSLTTVEDKLNDELASSNSSKAIKIDSREIDMLLKNYSSVEGIIGSLIQSQLTKPYYYIDLGRLSPLLLFSLYDFVNSYSSDTNDIDKTNKFIDNNLIYNDKEFPKEYFGFNKAKKSWKYIYQKYLKVKTKYPDNYRFDIEGRFGIEGDTTVQLPHHVYGGTINKVFKIFGILNELEWLWSQISNGISVTQIYKEVYKPLIEDTDIIRFDGYPHS